MENNPVKPLWNPNVEYPELRRPKTCLTNDNINNTQTSNTNINQSVANTSSISDVAKNSKLSVEAKEWYPPGYQNASTESNKSVSSAGSTHSVQNRLTKYKHPDEKHGKETEYLNDIIKTLTNKPGEFDDLIYEVLDFLSPHFNDIEFMSKITSAIFQQALTVPNFQYSGVRLFAVLDENCPLVRAILHSLCEKELENASNLQNVLLFYADIYSKLNFELFGKCLLKVLKNMKPSAENVKNICQTLKLTGGKLEILDKQLITEIIRQLDALRSTLPTNMSFLVESVIKLRNCQWGAIDAPPIVTQNQTDSDYDWADGPIFYGPDGLQLTSEESEFLAENLNDFMIDDTDPDALWNPEPEMNEEIQAAFVEFVRSNNR